MGGGNGSGEIRDFDHFLLWEHASRDAIMVKRVYIDMAGDVIAGLMLSQIVYWHLPNDEGKTRLRVEVDGIPLAGKGVRRLVGRVPPHLQASPPRR